MTDYWADLPQLRADGRRVLRWIRQQGVIMCRDPVERVKAAEFLLPVFQALEDVIRPMPLTALYGIGNGEIRRKPLTGFPEAVTRFWKVSGRG